jgi:ABC-2 type transport system ATP-binding protein
MIGYLRLELARTVRDGRYLVLAIVAPVGFYLLFSSVFGGPSTGSNTTFGLPASQEIMVAMATFGAMWAALTATAPRLARDQEGGWLAYLATTPLRPSRVLGARILAGLAVALPAIVAVGITAAIAHGVHLHAWQWASGLGLLWVGTLPFVALGIAIGSLTTSTVAYALSTGLWFALAALGGLWVPPSVLSASLRHFAAALPSYNQAALGWHVVSGSAPTVTNGLVLAAWTVGLALLPLVARHRSWWRRGAPDSPRVPEGSASDGSAIDLHCLAKRFGTVTALDGIDLEVSAGTIMGLLGPNGSGKTTTMTILLGLAEPDGGSARLFGSAPRRATRAGQVGVMLQDTELMASVGVGELLRFVRGLYPSPAAVSTLIEMAGLTELLQRRTDRLSGGQAQRVRFALAAAGNPPLLVLDEPTAAMDVQARQDFWAALGRHADESDTTVLFSTHYLNEADDHADRVALIRSGAIVADGTPDQVKAAASPGRLVRFRLLNGNADRFGEVAGVTSVRTERDHVTLQTSDADSTIWSLYDERSAIADIEVTEGSLEEAFLSLTSPS